MAKCSKVFGGNLQLAHLYMAIRSKEIPINHRKRFAGKTQVYLVKHMPEIGLKHFVALFQIRFQKSEINTRLFLFSLIHF